MGVPLAFPKAPFRRDAGFPAWFPGLFAVAMVGLQFALGPNAFTFGHTPRDARMWVTRGLVERLDHDELDAVVAHEVGHVKHWDFVLMTVAAAIPLALYYLYLVLRSSDRQGKAVAIVSYVAFVVSQFVLLAFCRARELAADHWSCEATGNGDALASALVKVAYGIGTAGAEQRGRAAALVAQGKDGKKQLRKLQRSTHRIESMRALGIFDPRHADAMAIVVGTGIDPDRAVAAMRWDIANPWGKTLEKLASHPLVASRIAALERSGLPGAPRIWSVIRASATVTQDERARLRKRFCAELAIAVAPWVILIAILLGALALRAGLVVGVAITLAGAMLLVKQFVRYPAGRFESVEEIPSLLERLDASPVRGIGVRVRGTVIGRGTPGYVLSPDLVIDDGSGFVPLLYRQPVPFGRAWFGIARVRSFMGREVVAHGWYRRTPGPVIELRSVTAVDGAHASCWEWLARYAASGVVLFAGLVTLAVAAGHG